MATYHARRIVERKVDDRLGWIEVLECGHIHLMSKDQKRSFPRLGKFGAGYPSSRQCFTCVKEGRPK